VEGQPLFIRPPSGALFFCIITHFNFFLVLGLDYGFANKCMKLNIIVRLPKKKRAWHQSTDKLGYSSIPKDAIPDELFYIFNRVSLIKKSG